MWISLREFYRSTRARMTRMTRREDWRKKQPTWINFIILLQSARLESGATTMDVHTEQSWYFTFTSACFRRTRADQTSRKRGGNSRPLSNESGKSPGADPEADAPAHRPRRYKLAPSAVHRWCNALLYCSAHTIPDTNRYVADLVVVPGLFGEIRW